jgi:hypothetical protein
MWYEHHPYKMEIVGSTPTVTTFSGFYVTHKLVTFIDFQQENAED